jgi:hypothetical protein
VGSSGVACVRVCGPRALLTAPPGLNVYADNHVARRLYESMGYVETARQLHKELGDEDPLVS